MQKELEGKLYLTPGSRAGEFVLRVYRSGGKTVKPVDVSQWITEGMVGESIPFVTSSEDGKYYGKVRITVEGEDK